MLENYEYEVLNSASPAYKSYGYVIKIVDERTILVSLSRDSVSVGDLVEVYENLAEVIDPVTGQKLGKYSVSIEEFIVTDAFNDYSICKVYKKSYNAMTNLVNALNPMMDEIDDGNLSILNPEQNESLKPTKQFVSVKDPIRVSRGKFNYKNYI